MLAHLIRHLDQRQLYTLLGILAAFRAILHCRAWNMLPTLLGTIGWAMLHKVSRAGKHLLSVLGTLIDHHRADSMAGYTALSAAGAGGIQGLETLRGTRMIIATEGEGIQCAPELVQCLHNWLFNAGDPPEGYADLMIYKFNRSAADHQPLNPFPSFRIV